MPKRLATFLVALTLGFFRMGFAASDKPNIVFILADDLGWNDVGYHKSSDILTPNIDGLLKKGIELEQHYVMPQCTPSRAAFLTGRYPIRYGLHHDSIQPSDTFGLPLTETLLPEELKRANYDTYMVGKWHLGFYAWEYTPTYRGFDYFWGFYNGAENYLDHSREWDGVEGYDLRDGTTPISRDNEYGTDIQSDTMISYIKNRNSEKPFFMYCSFQAVHSPNQLPDDNTVWKSYKDISDHSRRIHATKATIMDSAIGDLISTIEEEGIWDNTLIIFTSDNGAVYNAGSNYPLRGSKSTIWEGGIRVPAIISGGYIDSSLYGTKSSALFHISDWFPTLLEINGISSTNKELDGISQLSILQGSQDSVREGFLVHTDALDCEHTCGAYRWGKWKLIRDPRRTLKNEFTRDGCFWTDDFAKANSTSTTTCLLGKNNRPVTDECPCGTETCLFDLESDPCEEVNVADQYPQIATMLYGLLAGLNDSIAIPLSELYPPDTDGANPSIHNNFWTPWMNSDRTPRDNDDPVSYDEALVTINTARGLSQVSNHPISQKNTFHFTPFLTISFLLLSLIIIILGNYFRIFIANKNYPTIQNNDMNNNNNNNNNNVKETQENTPLLSNKIHITH